MFEALETPTTEHALSTHAASPIALGQVESTSSRFTVGVEVDAVQTDRVCMMASDEEPLRAGQAPEQAGGDRKRAAASSARDDRSIDPIRRRLDALRAMPDVRLDRIDAMREAIEKGDFNSPERLYAAINRMIEELQRPE